MLADKPIDIHKSFYVPYFLFSVIFISFFQTPYARANNADLYQIGTGIYDVTGLVASISPFGVGAPQKFQHGIHDRQYARAFIIKQNDKQAVVYVVVDAGAIMSSIEQEVSARLATDSQLKHFYNGRNVVIAATHSHTASGGHAKASLWSASTRGFVAENFEAAVNGIIGAIRRAHLNLSPGHIFHNTGSLTGVGQNRSLPAIANNPEYAGEQLTKLNAVDAQMQILKFVKQNGTAIGLLSFYALHPIDMIDSTLMSSDNYGFASTVIEKRMLSNYGANGFVAAFANTNPGDIEPITHRSPPSTDDLDYQAKYDQAQEDNAEINGAKIAEKAWSLFQSATETLSGSVTSYSRYIDLKSTAIADEFIYNPNQTTTCSAAIGYAYPAQGHTGIACWDEGMTQDKLAQTLSRENLSEQDLWQQANTIGGCALASAIVSSGLNSPVSQQDNACHAPKAILLNIGRANNLLGDHWVNDIYPITLIKIGQFGIAALPMEATITSARRIRETVLSIANTGIENLVIGGYADGFALYLSTFHEYQTQQYEGGGNLFGPNTLGALQTAFKRLAQHLATASSPWLSEEPIPEQYNQLGHVELPMYRFPFDTHPLFVSWGHIEKDLAWYYGAGETVSWQVWGGHPNNDNRSNDTYMKVQHYVDNNWVDIAWDRDYSTEVKWFHHVLPFAPFSSKYQIEWDIPEHTQPGLYRLVFNNSIAAALHPKQTIELNSHYFSVYLD